LLLSPAVPIVEILLAVGGVSCIVGVVLVGERCWRTSAPIEVNPPTPPRVAAPERRFSAHTSTLIQRPPPPPFRLLRPRAAPSSALVTASARRPPRFAHTIARAMVPALAEAPTGVVVRVVRARRPRATRPGFEEAPTNIKPRRPRLAAGTIDDDYTWVDVTSD
jgi:hypothetical protein